MLELIQETHQSIWGDRYENWAKMTPHEKMALTVEGMRGGHFSGERRRGDMTLRDDGDRLVMVMELCGSGGVLRRGDPETGRPPYPVGEHGVNQEPHLWTWQKTGIHWYCSHCAIAMEWLPGRQRGRLLRPLDHVMDPERALHLVRLQGRGADAGLSLSENGRAAPARRTGPRRALAGGVSFRH